MSTKTEMILAEPTMSRYRITVVEQVTRRRYLDVDAESVGDAIEAALGDDSKGEVVRATPPGHDYETIESRDLIGTAAVFLGTADDV